MGLWKDYDSIAGPHPCLWVLVLEIWLPCHELPRRQGIDVVSQQLEDARPPNSHKCKDRRESWPHWGFRWDGHCYNSLLIVLWETPSQRHLVKLYPDSWPIKTVRWMVNVCGFKLLNLGLICAAGNEYKWWYEDKEEPELTSPASLLTTFILCCSHNHFFLFPNSLLVLTHRQVVSFFVPSSRYPFHHRPPIPFICPIPDYSSMLSLNRTFYESSFGNPSWVPRSALVLIMVPFTFYVVFAY